MKYLIFILLVFPILSSAECDFKKATDEFEKDFAINFLGGKDVDFRYLPKDPSYELKSGKYDFIAEGGRWTGVVIVDLKRCAIKTADGWISWRADEDAGSVILLSY